MEGTDAANKWCLLLTHAYGAAVHPSQLLYNGIQHIQASDAAVATEKGFSVKLVAQAQKLGSVTVAGFV